MRAARPFLSLLLLSLFWLASAPSLRADDVANRRIIGFSPNGFYFAFLEFGLQNRTGNPYANLYVIDTRKNKWVKGTPYRTVLKQARATRTQARRAVERKAARLLSRLAIQRRRVRLLASNPITELGGNPHKVTINSSISIDPYRAPLVFSIKEKVIRTPRCKSFTRSPVKGMEIYVRRKGARKILLHEDTRIPKSRGCPLRYAISDIVQLGRPRQKGDVYAIIYSVIRIGRHGLERRFIAGGFHDTPEILEEPDTQEAPTLSRRERSEDKLLDYSDYDAPYQYMPGDRKTPSRPSDSDDVDPNALRKAYESPLNAPYAE